MKYKGLQFTNKSEKVVEIDIDGYIGWDPYDSPEDQVRTKDKMNAELKKIAKLQVETILVNINSFGGDVNHGISIHDLLAENKAKVITKVNGMTASSATIIAMSGDERHMSDNALYLVHNATSFGWGDKNDAKTLSEALIKVDDRIANISSKVTGKSKDEILDLMNEDKGLGKWLTADEAKGYGFITDVFEPLKAVAYFSNDILSRYQLPPIPGNQNPENNNGGSLPGGIAKQVISELIDFFTTNNNSQKMDKKEFKRLAPAAGLKSFEIQDNGIFLTVDQANAVESVLEKNENTINAYSGLKDGESIQGLRDQITSKTTENQTLSDDNKRLKTENEELSKETVDKTGAAAAGDDKKKKSSDPQAEYFYELSQIK